MRTEAGLFSVGAIVKIDVFWHHDFMRPAGSKLQNEPNLEAGPP
jgi:hypothetical protein